MDNQKWCYINSLDPNQQIVVTDAESAAILEKALKRLGGESWVLKGNENLVVKSVDLAPTVVVAPVVDQSTREIAKFDSDAFRVILIAGNSTFRCVCQDVSLDGMTLKKEAPDAFTKDDCVAYISHHDMRENIEVHCHVVKDATGATRVEFVGAEMPQLNRLKEWIEAS